MSRKFVIDSVATGVDRGLREADDRSEIEAIPIPEKIVRRFRIFFGGRFYFFNYREIYLEYCESDKFDSI